MHVKLFKLEFRYQSLIIRDRQLTYRRLEAAVQVGEVRTVGAKLQNSSLQHGAFHVVVLQNNILFQSFDGEVGTASLQFS